MCTVSSVTGHDQRWDTVAAGSLVHLYVTILGVFTESKLSFIFKAQDTYLGEFHLYTEHKRPLPL